MKSKVKNVDSVDVNLTSTEISTLIEVLEGYNHFVSALFPTVNPLDSRFFLVVNSLRSKFDSVLEESFPDLPF